jgi:hypothetical protein
MAAKAYLGFECRMTRRSEMNMDYLSVRRYYEANVSTITHHSPFGLWHLEKRRLAKVRLDRRGAMYGHLVFSGRFDRAMVASIIRHAGRYLRSMVALSWS